MFKLKVTDLIGYFEARDLNALIVSCLPTASATMHGMSLTTDTGEWLSRVVTLHNKHDVTEEDVKDIFDCRPYYCKTCYLNNN